MARVAVALGRRVAEHLDAVGIEHEHALRELVERSEQASASLLSDLRSDKGMEWTPDQMWLTYLRVQAPAGDLGYDLAASTRPNESPSLTDAGITAPEAHAVTAASTASPIWPVVAGAAVAMAAYVAFRSVPRLRTSRRAS